MGSIEWAVKVLAISLAICSFMLVAGLIFSPEFRQSGIAAPMGVVLGALGTPLAAIATATNINRGMRTVVEDEERKTHQEKERIDA